MANYFNQTKKYALTLGLTPGILWLLGGVLGVYFSKGESGLYLAAIIIGGFPVIITLLASRFNILGSILLFLEALLVLFLVYSEGKSFIIVVVLFLSYSLPLVLSGITFIRYWYKNKTRI